MLYSMLTLTVHRIEQTADNRQQTHNHIVYQPECRDEWARLRGNFYCKLCLKRQGTEHFINENILLFVHTNAQQVK